MPKKELLQIRVNSRMKEALKALSTREYQTISSLVVFALTEKFPELKEVKE